MGDLVCTVELNVTGGITVTVHNPDGKIKQTMTLDGTTIVTKVADENDSAKTSTITQKTDEINIKVKKFILDAEEIECKSSKTTKHTSQDTFDIQSTKDCTIKSDAKIVEKATGDLEAEGANVKIKATTDLKGDAMNVKLTGTTEASLKGMQLKLQGDGQGEMKAPMLNVKSDGMLGLEGQMTTLKGQMTAVQGSMITFG